MRITFVCQILEERVTHILHSSFLILHLERFPVHYRLHQQKECVKK